MPMKTKTLEVYLAELRRIEAHRTKNAEKNIKRIYKALLTDLQGWLGVKYANLADDGELSVLILQKKGEYARFLEEVEQTINRITPEAATEIRNVVSQTYEACYAGMVESVQKVADYGGELKAFRLLTAEVVKRAVENPIDGLTLPDRLERNRIDTIYEIKKNINIGLMNGDRYETMANRIRERVDISYRKAITTVRTESHRVREAGFNDSGNECHNELKDHGIVMVKTWRTMKDERVRPQRAAYKRKKGVKARKKFTAGLRSMVNAPNHVKMEGQTVLQDELFDLHDGNKTVAPSQSGVAGHDINCRCYASRDIMTVAEYEKKFGKTINKGKTIKDCETHEELEEYAKTEWGVQSVNPAISDMEFLLERGTFERMDRVFKEFPEIKGAVTNIGTTNSGWMCAKKNGKGCSINFNMAYYLNIEDLNFEYNKSVKSRFHVANTNLFDSGIHEASHAIESMVIDKLGYSDELAIETWESSEIAAGLVSEAYRALNNPDTKANEIGKISKYALTNESETLAEAVTDYLVNGEKAAQLTLEIIKAVKRLLKEVS